MTDAHADLPPKDHNRPPPWDVAYVEAASEEIRKRAAAAGDWLDRGELTSDHDAGKLKDFLDGTRKVLKAIETRRATDKAPVLAAGRAIDATYGALAEPLKRLQARLKPMISAWAAKKEVEARAAKDAEIKRLDAERKAAEEAARAAEQRNDVIGEVAAAERKAAVDATMKDIAKAKAVGRVESASGGGRAGSLRTYRICGCVQSRPLAISSLLKLGYEREIDALIERLANAELRKAGGAREIAGIEVIEKKEFV